MGEVAIRLKQVREQIQQVVAHESKAEAPLLIAVSKKQPVELLLEAYNEGQSDFGENYVQELVEKASFFQSKRLLGVRFHFIGHLQSNKIKMLLPFVSCIHSVDSLKLLKEIDRRAEALGQRVSIYLQVNVDEEASKGGFHFTEIGEVASRIKEFHSLIPLGLMCIPDSKGSAETAFKKMQSLSLQHAEHLGKGLSMGMSHDFKTAIQYGSTAIRVGTAIFGERK